jgi:chromosome segregation ATPase
MKKNNLKRQAVSRPLTEKVLGRYIKKVIETVDTKIGETRKALEAKIEYSRKDASGQIKGVQKALTAEISEIKVEVTGIKSELKSTQEGLKSVKEEVNELRSDVNELRSDVTEIQSEVSELRSEMKDMESRLSDKIDTIGVRLEEHESKPAAIAHPS